MQETFRAIITRWGARRPRDAERRRKGYGIAAGRADHHEVGVTRMGRRPVDLGAEQELPGARRRERVRRRRRPLVSQADKNCTWTILALSMKTAEYIAEQRKGGTL
jgi:hypothetical protein